MVVEVHAIRGEWRFSANQSWSRHFLDESSQL